MNHFAFRCIYYRVVAAEGILGALICLLGANLLSGTASLGFAAFGALSLYSGVYFYCISRLNFKMV